MVALGKLFIVLLGISCFVLMTEIKGVHAQFKFLKPWGMLLRGELKWRLELDCTTNDQDARTELWKGSRNVTGVLPRDGDIYIIKRAVVRDGGRYTCKAFNKAGNVITKSTNVLLLPSTKPRYVKWPTFAQVRQVGESVTFRLEATRLEPKITWRKHIRIDGKDVTLNITADKDETVIKTEHPNLKFSYTLTLKNLQVKDGGHYQAIATYRSQIHNEFYTVSVFAATKPVLLKISPDFQTSESSDKLLNCVALGYPPPELVWFKDGVEIPLCKEDCKNAKHQQSETHQSANKSEGDLTIKGVTYKDAGVYKCKAINKIGSAEATTKLIVLTRPVLEKSHTLAYQSKKVARVTCKQESGRGVPLPRFTWMYHEYKPCSNDSCCSNIKIDEWRPLPSSITYDPPLNRSSASSTIIIPPSIPPVGQAACYRCEAVNKIGNDSVTFELHRFQNTEEAEFLKIRPAKQQVLNVLDTLKLQCFLLLGKLHPSIILQKDGIQVDHNNDPRITHKFSFAKNASDIFGSRLYTEIAITISNLTVNDSGLYSCHLLGENLNKSVYVQVKEIVPPKLSWKQEGITVFEQNYTTVRLQCVLEQGNPKPEFSWTRNKKPLHPMVSENPNCETLRDGLYFAGNNNQEVIICGKNPKYEDYSGLYTCKARNKEGEDEISTELNILARAKILYPVKREIVVRELGSVNLTCRARGNPSPVIQWWKGSKFIKEEKDKNTLWLPLKSVGETDFGNYSCVAKNWYSDQRFVIVVKEAVIGRAGGQLKKEHIIGLVIGCVLFVLLVVIITCFVWRRQKKKMDLYYMRASGMNNYELDPDRSILEQVNDIPYDLDWEFREDRLILGKTLGSGAFGQVVKAEAIGILAFNPRDKTSDAFKRRSKIRRSVKFNKMEQDPQHWKFAKTTVAVKMLKENAGEAEYRDLASEIKIMIHIGEHQNIINILGACTQGKKLMLIMEFAVHGSLLHFLRERRSIYRPSWTKTTNDPKEEYTLVDQVMAAFQIARGMEFLASRKCIHRDLAARNVLIGQDYVMKIADFGLARDIYKNDEYVKQTSGLLPVKWMALESLFDRTYTEKSDVWAFGIVLWEIFTLGGTPYPGLPTENLLDFLTEGRRMLQPEHCPLEVYAIMRDCWMQEPESRPHFLTLAEHLGKILEKNVTKDNPYIILAVEETEKGNNYYLNPVDDPRLSVNKPSTSNYYESPSPLNFEPIDSPHTAAMGGPRGYDSPLPSLPPALPEEEPNSEITDYPLPLPPVPPSYDEALAGEEDSAVREKAQLAEEEKKRMAKAPPVREGSKSSADEGIGLDENGQNDDDDEGQVTERSQLLGSPTPTNAMEMQSAGNGATRFSPNPHGNGRMSMESTV